MRPRKTRKKLKLKRVEPPRPELLVGARNIANYIFQDEAKRRWVYDHADELGCFYWNGSLAARPRTIDQRIRKREVSAHDYE
jgi:hypothetical protein